MTGRFREKAGGVSPQGGFLRRKRSIQIYITGLYTTLIVLAMLVVGIVLYDKFSSTAEKGAFLNTDQVVDQVNFNVEYYLRGMAELFEQLEEKITKSPVPGGSDLTEQLAAILNTRKDLVSVTVVSRNGQVLTGYPGTTLRRETRLTDQKWFTVALERPNYLHYSSPHVQNLFPGEYRWVVSLSRSVTVRNGDERVEGVMLLDVNFSSIDDLCQRVSLGNKGFIYITDPDGRLIYHPQQQLINLGLKEEVSTARTLNYSYGSFYETVGGEKRLVHVKTVKNIGWKIIGVAYMDELVTSTKEVSGFMVWLLALVLVIVVMMSAYMSGVISKPIKRLGQSMKNVERGDFETPIQVRGALEVEQLVQRFNLMVSRIRDLMQQNIREQEAKRKSELEVLQAQINPHFLYNTLNSVVRLAESGKNTDVVTMITSLSRLFRISLSKGRNIIPLEDELEHIKNYLIIQNIRFKNKFDYAIEAAPETMSCMSLKLILQPLVENAIQHGIEMMQDEGFIRITSEIRDGKLLLQVIDNGLGMSPETAARLLAAPGGGGKAAGGETAANSKSGGSGVGVRNVHERIRLTFGSEYGLEFESELEEGTTVRIWLPVFHELLAGDGEAGGG
ncbi:histidine kinase [Gorillibacterium sp. sgz5001074]|uniref:histidine kinase n=1 Tax=Gorillibacterium sp. sgz5001074 TaxID=3446695 RepID=UPI003F66BC71